MAQTFGLIRKVLAPGGYACFVIGRSRIHGRVVDNARIVEDAAAGFDRVYSTERVLSANRKILQSFAREHQDRGRFSS